MKSKNRLNNFVIYIFKYSPKDWSNSGEMHRLGQTEMSDTLIDVNTGNNSKDTVDIRNSTGTMYLAFWSTRIPNRKRWKYIKNALPKPPLYSMNSQLQPDFPWVHPGTFHRCYTWGFDNPACLSLVPFGGGLACQEEEAKARYDIETEAGTGATAARRDSTDSEDMITSIADHNTVARVVDSDSRTDDC